MGFVKASFLFVRALFTSRLELAVENLALRQQLAVVQQSNKRPKSRLRDRVFWTCLRRRWPDWQSAPDRKISTGVVA